MTSSTWIGRERFILIYLDTHAVIWLYSGDKALFSEKALEKIENNALAISMDFTRDPFDRLITAHAALDNNLIITKDRRILKNYPGAVW